MNKESIICSAIWINDGIVHEKQPKNIPSGFVISGRRHKNCYETHLILTGMSVFDKYYFLYENENELRKYQGFITSSHRYVDRKEAWGIAKDNNQIVFGLKVSDIGDDSILISENLY